MKQERSKMTDLLALLVFGVFALCVLLVLLTGARVYRGLVEDGEELYTRRTVRQYLTTRVRQAEWVAVEDFAGCQALVLGETLEGERYVTRVYCQEGILRELYCDENAALSPEDGEEVLPVAQLSFRLDGDQLFIEAEGDTLQLYLPSLSF